MDVLRWERVPGVVKELLLFVVVYPLVRRVRQEASRRQEVAPDRLSFVDALRWLRQWVAYHGDQRLFIGRSKRELVQRCVRRGIPRDEYIVYGIEPEIPDEDEIAFFSS